MTQRSMPADERDWPDSTEAVAWARTWRLDEHAIRQPAELRGLSGDEYKRRAAELKQAGVPGADSNSRIGARPLRRVLVAVSDLFGIEGPYAWCSQEVIAERTGHDVRTVRRALAVLTEQGLIVPQSWYDADTSRRLATRYYLPMFHDCPAATGHVLARRRPLDGSRLGRYEPVDTGPASDPLPDVASDG